MSKNTESTESHDYLIVGAGPAGLQLAYYLERAGRDYLVLEAGEKPGAFFEKFPRHRKLISINKVYTGHDDPELNLRWDWNSLLTEEDDAQFRFSEYSKRYFPGADDLCRYLADFAEKFALNVRTGSPVKRISRGEDGGFAVRCGQEELKAKRVIVSTGVSKPYTPKIPGIELCEQYVDIDTDPDTFTNQRVLVIGKGNSGFEMADSLIENASLIHLASRHPIRMAWQSHYVGHLRAVNNNLLDTYQLKSQNAVLDAEIRKIERKDGAFRVSFAYAHAEGERESLVYDRIVVCTGFRFDASIFDASCVPELAIDGRFPAQTCEWESANVPGLFFAGTIMQERDFKKYTSGFIHGFRYNVRALGQFFEERFHGNEVPFEKQRARPVEISTRILARINRTSALWQQPGFLCDAWFPKAGRYYEQLPVQFVEEKLVPRFADDEVYVLTLEYGDFGTEDPFTIERISRDNVERAADSKFLHPIIRRYGGGKQIGEHHVLEDLAAEWVEPVHRKPLLEFFEAALGKSPARKREAVPAV